MAPELPGWTSRPPNMPLPNVQSCGDCGGSGRVGRRRLRRVGGVPPQRRWPRPHLSSEIVYGRTRSLPILSGYLVAARLCCRRINDDQTLPGENHARAMAAHVVMDTMRKIIKIGRAHV